MARRSYVYDGRSGVPHSREGSRLVAATSAAQGRIPYHPPEPRPATPLLRRLRRFVRDCEHRYELSSDQAREAVRLGRIRETSEVSRWMQVDLVLKRLGSTNGTPTKTTASRMRAS